LMGGRHGPFTPSGTGIRILPALALPGSPPEERVITIH